MSIQWSCNTIITPTFESSSSEITHAISHRKMQAPTKFIKIIENRKVTSNLKKKVNPITFVA
jgi:hypothetical protein